MLLLHESLGAYSVPGVSRKSRRRQWPPLECSLNLSWLMTGTGLDPVCSRLRTGSRLAEGTACRPLSHPGHQLRVEVLLAQRRPLSQPASGLRSGGESLRLSPRASQAGLRERLPCKTRRIWTGSSAALARPGSIRRVKYSFLSSHRLSLEPSASRDLLVVAPSRSCGAMVRLNASRLDFPREGHRTPRKMGYGRPSAGAVQRGAT